MSLSGQGAQSGSEGGQGSSQSGVVLDLPAWITVYGRGGFPVYDGPDRRARDRNAPPATPPEEARQ